MFNYLIILKNCTKHLTFSSGGGYTLFRRRRRRKSKEEKMEAKLEFKNGLENIKMRFYESYVEVCTYKTPLFSNKEKDTWAARINYGMINRIEHEEYMDQKTFGSRVRGYIDITLCLNSYVPGINSNTPTFTFDVMFTKSNGTRIGDLGDEGDCRRVAAELDSLINSVK